MSVIHLPTSCLGQAIKVAYKRCIPALVKNSKQTSGETGTTNWGRFVWDVEAVMAEQGAAMFLGIKDFEPSVNTFHSEPDIPPDIEVRSTSSHRNTHLILRPSDKPDRRYIFCYVELWRQVWQNSGLFQPVVTLVGWCYGQEGMKKDYLENHNEREPAWFVPQDETGPLKSVMQFKQYEKDINVTASDA